MPSRTTLYRHAKAKAEGRAVRSYVTRAAKLLAVSATWEKDHGITRCCACIMREESAPDCVFCASLLPEPDEVQMDPEEADAD